MKHAVKGKQLNRNIGTRRALFKNLMLALMEHGQIKTTEAKAKAVRSQFEKLITKAIVGTVQYRRLIGEVLNRRQSVNHLVDEIAPAMKRTSGFTRITKLGRRRGDDAEMVRLEIIDWQPKTDSVKKKAKSAVTTKVADEAKGATSSKASKQEEKPVSKVKRPTTASTQAKHIPQKRITGGGK